LFVSCGALRTLEVVQALEQRVGKPVVASNQAMNWDCLRLAGVDDRIEGCGTLLSGF
jgi:maleate isomerase